MLVALRWSLSELLYLPASLMGHKPAHKGANVESDGESDQDDRHYGTRLMQLQRIHSRAKQRARQFTKSSAM
jgi:hypothetical protein